MIKKQQLTFIFTLFGFHSLLNQILFLENLCYIKEKKLKLHLYKKK
jgi:hypothetical protein